MLWACLGRRQVICTEFQLWQAFQSVCMVWGFRVSGLGLREWMKPGKPVLHSEGRNLKLVRGWGLREQLLSRVIK